MKINNIYILWILCGLLCLIAVGTFFWFDYKNNNFTCQAESVLVIDNTMLSLFSQFTFDNGKGKYNSTGYLKIGQSSEKVVIQSFRFSYKISGSKLTMTSDEESQHSQELQHTLPSIPDFFFRANRGVSYEMIKLNSSNFIIAQSETPLLICRKIN
jgi:hypothetical protein